MVGHRFDVKMLEDPPFKKPAGVLHRVGVGNAIKATCGMHTKCVCWVTPRVPLLSDSELWMDLSSWCVDGRRFSPTEHAKASVDLKRSYGMNVG